MPIVIKTILILAATSLAGLALTRLKAAPKAPRLLKWGATAGLAWLAVRR